MPNKNISKDGLANQCIVLDFKTEVKKLYACFVVYYCQLLQRMNKVHITLSAESKRNILKDFGEHVDTNLVAAIRDGQDGKINGDNLDLRVTTNDVRMKNRDKDYHFFASDFTPYRVNASDFLSNSYLQQYQKGHPDKEITVDKFMLSNEDMKMYKETLAMLIGRQLSSKFKTFKWMGKVVPEHIDHPLQDVMSRKTTSFQLPILLKNESKYEDCLGIMDSYEQQFASYYNRAGRG